MLSARRFPLISGLFVAFGSASALANCPESGHCHLAPWAPVSSDAFDQVGKSVSLSDTYAVFGAPGDEAVYVYRLVEGIWQPDGILNPVGSSSGEDFGESVHVDGDRILVGAPGDDEEGNAAGAAYVYDRGLAGWNFSGKLTAFSTDAFDQLGTDVALQGDTAYVGAPGVSGGGSVLVFLRGGGSWSQSAAISRADTGSFGFALDVHGPDLIVGDWQDNDNGQSSGAIHHYDLDGIAITHREKILAPDGASNDFFGSALAVDSGHLIVGAYGDDDNNGDNAGAAYVFERELNIFPIPPSYEFAEKLVACDSTGADNFGRSVEIHGKQAVVGAPFYNGTGGVFSFERDDSFFIGDWDASDLMTSASESPDDRLGWSVAVRGKRCIAGANWADSRGDRSGQVYLFTMAPSNGTEGLCSCERLAYDESYGLGKPGTNGIPRIDANQPGYLGDTLEINLVNGLAGATPALLIGLGRANIPFDGGEILVANPKLTVLPPLDGNGRATLSGNIPDAPALCGVSLYFQYLFVDPGATGTTAQSHGFQRSLGY